VTDFASLSRAAREQPGPETHDRLWSAWIALPAWHFIKARSPTGWLPFAGYVNGVRCILGFTDPVRALDYVRFAGLPIDPRIGSPVMSMPPEAMLQLVPQLRMWGVSVLAVDPGPDAFYQPLDALFGMWRKYRTPTAPPPPRPVPRTPAQALSVDALLALPAWHLVTTRDDPSFPDLAFQGTELVAQIYSSAQAVARHAGSPPTAVMTPRDALSLLSDIELVGFVRFDGQLEVQFVDLKLQFVHHSPIET
jgi:hypothetical protein